MSLIQKINKTFVSLYDKISQADKSWNNRSYDFYLMFGDQSENNAPWLKSNWTANFEPYLDLLIKQVDNNKETGLRVNKTKPEKRVAANQEEFIYHSDIKRGRLKWDTKSHDKWTLINNEEESFNNLEIWTPIWTICEKRDIPPEIYINISNQKTTNDLNIQCGYYMVVAVARSLEIDNKSIMSALSEKVNPKITVLKKRRWGSPENNEKWIFNNGIQDTFVSGIYKDYDLSTADFEKVEFEPFWEVIYRQK